jgi:1-acyl-sn-glycerol-3-phosphate acyltransferase
LVYYIARRVLNVLFRVIWRPRLEGLENVPKSGPVLIASNHLSFSDSVIIPVVMPRRVHFLAKQEYFTTPGFKGRAMKVFFTIVGAVPVKRSGRRDDAMDALTTGLGVLQDGGAFALYPEGTRSRDGRLYRGRTGVAWLALKSGASIIPVGVVGTDKLQPIGARMPRMAKVTLHFGKPIEPQAYLDRLAAGVGAGVARRELTDEVMDAIAAVSGQPRAQGYNEPPPGQREPEIAL